MTTGLSPVLMPHSGQEGSMVTIRFGCQKLELEADGRTVGELAEAAEGVLNTAGNESFRVEGKGGVDGDYVPADGDVVELVKPAGSKG